MNILGKELTFLFEYVNKT